MNWMQPGKIVTRPVFEVTTLTTKEASYKVVCPSDETTDYFIPTRFGETHWLLYELEFWELSGDGVNLAE